MDITLIGSGKGRSLFERWRRLSSEFAPVHKHDELWRHSSARLASTQRQGWKIHVSATILTASDVLEIAGPYLVMLGVPFKTAASLAKLEGLNAGLWHGYSQIGKFMTIYPADEQAFRKIVEDLAALMPPGIAAPSVPFDLRFRNTNIYYRYGSFVSGDDALVLRRTNGELVPDLRDCPCPEWLTDPFADVKTTVAPSSFPRRYLVSSSLSQRGKGGVYEAFDIGTVPPRVCIIKEGRRNGETGRDGRDGRARVENEAKSLAELRLNGVRVPEVYDSFEVEDNKYLVLERIEGEDLQRLLNKRTRRLSVRDTINMAKQVAELMADIHRAGRVWRDCKPANLFFTKDRTVRPVDFEGSCLEDSVDDLAWSSPKFSAPEVICNGYKPNRDFPFAEDLYSLGATLFYLIEAKLPKDAHGEDSAIIKFRRRGFPLSMKETVLQLLNDDPASRLSAETVLRRLNSI